MDISDEYVVCTLPNKRLDIAAARAGMRINKDNSIYKLFQKIHILIITLKGIYY